MPLDERDALEIVEEVESRYHTRDEAIDKRRGLHHNDPDWDPKLPAPYNLAYPFQSQRPNRVGAQYVSRIDENHFIINGTGKGGTAANHHAADRVAQYLYSGLIGREQQLGYTLQRAMAIQQARDWAGVLHWMKADDLLPAVRDRESDDERQEAIAEAGFPWWIEVPDVKGIMPIPDRSPKPGYGAVVVRRRVAALRYIRERRQNDTHAMTIPENLPIGMERDAPEDTDPSGSGWKGFQTMYQIWTREEWTEILKDGKDVELFGGNKHPYRRPPFSVAPAIYNHLPDPVQNYEPRLNSMYRLKENLDYAMALFFAAAEWGMLPYWYLESKQDGTPMLTGDDGQLLLFDRQNIASAKIPKGYELKPLNHEISPSYVEGLRILTEEYDRAQPSTGRASFESSSPQPWSVRLEQAQESVEPGEDLDAQRRTIQDAVDNMRMVHGLEAEDGGFGENMSIYPLDPNGNRSDKMLTVSMQDFRNSMVTVDISNVSSAEQIADIQHGMELLNNPLTKVTPRYFLDNIMRVGNAAEMMAEYDGYELFENVIKPATQRQLVVAKIGHIVRVGTDGMLVGNDGQPVADEQAITAAGGQVEPVGTPESQGANPQSQEGGESLPPLATPGTTQIPGIR